MDNQTERVPSNPNSEDEADLFCPALPPKLLKENSSKSPKRAYIVGPTLPPNYKPADYDAPVNYPEESEDEEEEEDIIGPLPSATKDDEKFSGPIMEDRLQRFIADTSKGDNKNLVRESWMTELPSGKSNILGLSAGPRQFRKKAPQDLGDRSVWTDTPEDRERKEKLKECTKDDSPDYTIEEVASKRRDEELSSLVNTLDKKRSVPLVETHKIKKAKLEESKPLERKPFDRDEDMNVNKFDEAQKATIMKKARQLNDRFSAGNRKFL